jgi:hypothetical protein
VTAHVARWDLDKTYLRTEFDTVRDLVKTALERPDEKRTNPGASSLLREMIKSGVSVHILSGSPTQMRKRLEDKLRLDGIVWDSFTLKPNLKNVLRLRFRALRDQLGYKLPALLDARARKLPAEMKAAKETLFGDDAEADAFVYSLYGDVLAGRVKAEELARVCERGNMYEDVLERTVESARMIEAAPIVERVLIHLEGQTPPDEFGVYGARVVPFYNYLQAAFVVHEDGRVSADGVLRVAAEMVDLHRFDGDQLVRSYAEIGRRGHLRGERVDALVGAFDAWAKGEKHAATLAAIREMVERLPDAAKSAQDVWVETDDQTPDYAELVEKHNPRHKKKKKS